MEGIRFFRTSAVMALLLLVPALAFGQAVNFAQIQGRITDSTGAAIPAAKIAATQMATGLVRTTTTNAEGNYILPNLPVGSYQLQVSATGFREYLQKGIVLQVGQNPTIDVALQVGTVSEKVEVTAAAAMVETHENSVSQVIDNARIMELPLNGRSAPDLIMLTGAATNPTLSNNDLISSKNYGNASSGVVSGTSNVVSLAGSQENATNFLLDGGDNNDAFSNVNGPFPFPDAIQEFSVQTSGLSARYGVHGGSVVSVVSKSGTNNFHGSAFEFLRNPIVNAHHWLATPLATGQKDDTIKRNQFGGTFGGPIKKDKVMFFLGFQSTKQTSTPSASTATVPTSAMLAGDFSTAVAKGCLKTPKTTAVTTPQGSVQFVGNKISPTFFNPAALQLVKLLPSGDSDPTGCGKISFFVPQKISEDQGISKIDWNVSPKQQIFARYFASDFRAPQPYDGTNILTQSTASQFSRWQSLVLSDTYSFSSGLVNSLHATGTRLAINRGPDSSVPNPTSFGINVPSPVANGVVVSTGYVNIMGGSQMPGHFDNNLYQIADDIDWMKGKHQLSFGANWMKMQLNYLSTFQSNGQFTFANSNGVGDALMNFLLGVPSSFTQGNYEWENWRYTYWGLYAHDTIRLRNNLTLNAGIRWEPFQPSTDTAHRGSHFDYAAFMANQHSTVFPNAPAGLSFCGDPGVPCAFAQNKLKDFSPRAGLIWDPMANGKMTIRAGYGLFFDMPEMYYFDRYADNSPFGSAVTFTPNVAAGHGGLTDPYYNQASVPVFPLPFPKAGSNAYFPVNGVYINNNYDIRPMYVQNWNLAIERQLGENWLISGTYLGSKTTHIWQAYEANPGLVQNTVATPATSAGGSGCAANQAPTTSNTNCRRALVVANPTQGQYFSTLTTLWDGADANYNALLLTAKHRMSNNFTVISNYTWSHCISDSDFTGELTTSRPTMMPSAINNPNPANLIADRGACGFDVRHSFNTSLVISSPKFEGGKGMLLNNWQFAPLFTYRTGTPINVVTGTDFSLTGIGRDRPNVVGDWTTGTCTNGFQVGDIKNCYFNTSAFANPANGTFGSAPRNYITGPGNFRFDASVSRQFRITEGKSLSLRLETFNVLNHPNFNNPSASLSNLSTFGKINSQNLDGRTFQAAAKFVF